MNEFMLSIFFSTIGIAYMSYGKKNSRTDYLLIGLVLLVYTYFVDGVWTISIIGGILCALPYILDNFFRWF